MTTTKREVDSQLITMNAFDRLWETVREPALQALDRVGRSASWILGAETRRFEAALAAQWGRRFAIGVANGTDALEIGLRATGCQAGDRVLTTPLSAFATTQAILRVGAVPIYCDVDERGLIDLDAAEDVLKRDPAIRYLVPVHLYGHPLDPIRLSRLQSETGVQVIEDCAQSLGATSRGRPTGLVGAFTATSFYPTKNLGAMGDAGALLTDDPRLDELARKLRNYGQGARDHHELLGSNSRLDEAQAAILHDAMLPQLGRWLARRESIAQRYETSLDSSRLSLFIHDPEMRPSRHLFPVLIPHEGRAAFRSHLKDFGVETLDHYPRLIPDQPVMRAHAHAAATKLDRARTLAASVVTLPIHPFLTDGEVARVIAAARDWATETR